MYLLLLTDSDEKSGKEKGYRMDSYLQWFLPEFRGYFRPSVLHLAAEVTPALVWRPNLSTFHSTGNLIHFQWPLYNCRLPLSKKTFELLSPPVAWHPLIRAQQLQWFPVNHEMCKMSAFSQQLSSATSWNGHTSCLPSTREVSNVTFAALRLPAGKFKPIFSSLSRKDLPPFFDLALKLQELTFWLTSECSWNKV